MTVEQLGAMSDFERNTTLFELCMPENCFCYEVDKRPNSDSVHYQTEFEHVDMTFDFNNPSDIMPLAFEHKIGVEFIDGFGWTASHAYDLTKVSCYGNPLRAVVMCLILHLQK